MNLPYWVATLPWLPSKAPTRLPGLQVSHDERDQVKSNIVLSHPNTQTLRPGEPPRCLAQCAATAGHRSLCRKRHLAGAARLAEVGACRIPSPPKLCSRAAPPPGGLGSVMVHVVSRQVLGTSSGGKPNGHAGVSHAHR